MTFSENALQQGLSRGNESSMPALSFVIINVPTFLNPKIPVWLHAEVDRVEISTLLEGTFC